MGFPVDPDNGDEYTNENGTIFRYVAVDNKWIIINDIVISDEAYNEANWDGNTDAPSKNAVRDIIEEVIAGSGLTGDTCFKMLDLIPVAPACIGGVIYLATGEYVYTFFQLDPSEVDTSKDVIIKLVYYTSQNDAAVALKKYAGACKTNGTEEPTWNISNGAPDSVACTAVLCYTYTFTFSAAVINDDDILTFMLYNNDAATGLRVEEAYAEYTHV